MKKAILAVLAVAFAAAGIAVASTECAVEAVDGAKVTVACEAGKVGDKVNMKAGETTAACVVDSVADGKSVMTCKDATVKAGDKVTIEAAADEKKGVEGC